LTLPNFITIARLLGVPLIVWLIIAGRYVEATLCFVVAGLSDAVDGFIAKRFGATSVLGAYLDPIADKALLVSVFVTLGFKGVLPAWLIVLVVSRDLFIVGGVILSYMLGNPTEVRPLVVSKLNTGAQIGLVVLVLADHSLVPVYQPLIVLGAIAVAGLTVASAAAYLVDWVRHMAGGTAGPGERTP
jgi:cardiolipin synthase